MKDGEKNKKLENLKPKKYRIYGIFNFKTNRMVYISMDSEMVDFEFDMNNYNSTDFDVVEFDILIG